MAGTSSLEQPEVQLSKEVLEGAEIAREEEEAGWDRLRASEWDPDESIYPLEVYHLFQRSTIYLPEVYHELQMLQ